MSLSHIIGILADKAELGFNANVIMVAYNATSGAMPSHVTGDYLVAYAYRDGNNNTAALPAGWTALVPTGLVGTNSQSGLLAYKIAASSGETSGTWTNADGLILAVVHAAGAGPLGLGADSNITEGNSTSIAAQAITLANGDGHSVILHFGGHRNTSQTPTVPPAGMTNGVGLVGGGCSIGGNYSTTGVSSWATANAAWGGTASGWASTTLEITGAA